MAKGGGSQLSQLKSKLHSSGVTDRRQLSKKSRSRKGGQDEKDAAASRLNKINSIVSGLNPFDTKVTKPKHEVLGRKIKGAVGRPGAAKASGLAQRRETLLPEWQARNRSGTFVDRRFGENDANMTPEEKMLERYATEKQRRAAKGAAFNLNDDDELLTHYGQSLSGLDDLADIRLPGDDDDEEDTGRLTAQGHFGGFGENEDGDKSKADVMREVIAKSKYHKLERQKMKDADDELREQLDDELADIRGLLYDQAPVPTPAPAPDPKAKAKINVFPGPAATGANATAIVGNAKMESQEGAEEKPANSYDTFVRELAFERRAKPQDRLKSEEELAAEEAQRLMKAEKARLKRMRGDSDDEGEEEQEQEGGRRKRKKGTGPSSGTKRAAKADDLDDDFELDGMTAGEEYGLGAGLAESGAVDEGDDEEQDEDGEEEEDKNKEEGDEGSEGREDEEEDDEDDLADLADADDAIQIGEDQESEQEGDHEALTGSSSKAGSSSQGGKAGASKAKSTPVAETKLPFTFPCPATHDELLSLLEAHSIEPKHIPTVIKRIRTLHHPSLAEDNKYRLQALIGVLVDHALHWAGQAQLHQSKTGEKHKLAFAIVNSVIPHIFSLSQNYPAASAEHFVGKLALMQRNLSRGLAKGPIEADARTWPRLPELTMLRLMGSVWPTSDKQHNVTTPLALLIAQYLGHARIRSVSDLASGLFLCSLVVSNEKESKRLFPEALNFLFSAVAILAPLGGEKKQRQGLAKVHAVAEEYGIPTPDVNAHHTRHLRLSGEVSVEQAQEAVDLPSLITSKLTDDSALQQQQSSILLPVALSLISNFSELYNGSTSYVELFTPFSTLLSLSPSTCSTALSTSLDRNLKNASSSRRYLRLQAHRAIAIASHVPKFDQQGYNPDRKSALDPDADRVQMQKMKALIKKERKGAIRELRRDNQFIAEVRRQDQAEEDQSYKKKMDKIMSTLQVERSEQKQLERAKANIKRRAGKK